MMKDSESLAMERSATAPPAPYIPLAANNNPSIGPVDYYLRPMRGKRRAGSKTPKAKRRKQATSYRGKKPAPLAKRGMK